VPVATTVTGVVRLKDMANLSRTVAR
jgi:hypothetical protein